MLVFFTFINLFIHYLIKSIIYCQTAPFACCENCISGFSAVALNLSKSGHYLFRSVPNGNCLVSSASFLLVGDNTLLHELRLMAAAVLHVKSTYYTRHPVFKLVFEKSQSLMGGKLFSSLGRSANIEGGFWKVICFIHHLKALNKRMLL